MPNINFDNLPNETWLDSAQQRAFFGGVSEMWLFRRERASRAERARREREGLPAKPGPGEMPLYPLPRYDPRKRQKLGDLREYIAALPITGAPFPCRTERKAEQQKQNPAAEA
jgi:hypothetical protein